MPLEVAIVKSLSSKKTSLSAVRVQIFSMTVCMLILLLVKLG